VFDGESAADQCLCRSWFWGVSFQLTGRKSYGNAPTLDDAKAAFKAEYEKVIQCPAA
jgi:hypothetical protein